MIIFKAFQGLENFYIKFHDFPYFSRICTNPVKYLHYDTREYCMVLTDRERVGNNAKPGSGRQGCGLKWYGLYLMAAAAAASR